MGRRNFKPEEIIAHLREIEVRLSKGETAGHAVRAAGSPSRPTTGGAASMPG